MTWVVFRIFKSSTFALLIKLCLYPNHVSLMLNVCKQRADRVSNNGSPNTSVCGSLAECHSPQTKMTVCPDVAYSKTCSQKVPGRALVVFLSAYTKQGSGGRTVGPWALKGFSEAAVTGTASWWGGVKSAMVSSQHSEGWFIRLRCCAYTFLHCYTEKRIMGKHSTQRYTRLTCTPPDSQHIVGVCQAMLEAIADCYQCIQYCWCWDLNHVRLFSQPRFIHSSSVNALSWSGWWLLV